MAPSGGVTSLGALPVCELHENPFDLPLPAEYLPSQAEVFNNGLFLRTPRTKVSLRIWRRLSVQAMGAGCSRGSHTNKRRSRSCGNTQSLPHEHCRTCPQHGVALHTQTAPLSRAHVSTVTRHSHRMMWRVRSVTQVRTHTRTHARTHASKTHTHTTHTTHHTHHTPHNTQHTTHKLTTHTTHNSQLTTHNTQHTTHNAPHTTHNTPHTTPHNTTQLTTHNTQHTQHRGHFGSSFTVRRQYNLTIEAKAQYQTFASTKRPVALIHGTPREMVLLILQLVTMSGTTSIVETVAEAGQAEQMQGTQDSGRVSNATPYI